MEEITAVKTEEAAAPPVEKVVVDDNEARIADLEAEKAKLIEESANYKLGMMKAKARARDEGEYEDDEERIRRITQETIANSRLAEIAREQDSILQKALKENKELKLAHLNKTEPAAAVGVHSESTPVRDTLVTADQMTAFKARGWSDKDIDRYKKNLQRYAH